LTYTNMTIVYWVVIAHLETNTKVLVVHFTALCVNAHVKT